MDQQEYKVLIANIKKTYKPKLKNLSKNNLINIIVEMSAKLAMHKQPLSEEEQTKEEHHD